MISSKPGQPRDADRDPAATPVSAPASVISRLSSTIVRRTCQRDEPSARSTPISRVRSITDIASVLTTPSRLTITAIATIALNMLNVAVICVADLGLLVGQRTRARGRVARGRAARRSGARARARLGVASALARRAARRWSRRRPAASCRATSASRSTHRRRCASMTPDDRRLGAPAGPRRCDAVADLEMRQLRVLRRRSMHAAAGDAGERRRTRAALDRRRVHQPVHRRVVRDRRCPASARSSMPGSSSNSARIGVTAPRLGHRGDRARPSPWARPGRRRSRASARLPGP